MIVIKEEDGERVRGLMYRTHGINLLNTEWTADFQVRGHVCIVFDYSSDEDTIRDLLQDEEVHHEVRFR